MTFSQFSARTVAQQLMQQTHLPTFPCSLSEMKRSRLGVRWRQDALRRGRPLMGWFHAGSRLTPQLKKSSSGFSVSSVGTSESRGQKKCPHFYPHVASVHLDILGSFLRVSDGLGSQTFFFSHPPFLVLTHHLFLDPTSTSLLSLAAPL